MPDAAAYTIIYRARGMTVVITPTLPREKKISESTELENIFSERRVGRARTSLYRLIAVYLSAPIPAIVNSIVSIRLIGLARFSHINLSWKQLSVFANGYFTVALLY